MPYKLSLTTEDGILLDTWKVTDSEVMPADEIDALNEDEFDIFNHYAKMDLMGRIRHEIKVEQTNSK